MTTCVSCGITVEDKTGGILLQISTADYIADDGATNCACTTLFCHNQTCLDMWLNQAKVAGHGSTATS